jgi:serine/threonine protein kinase
MAASESTVERDSKVVVDIREFYGWNQNKGHKQKALNSIKSKETLGTGTFGRVRLCEDPDLRKKLEEKEMIHSANCFFALKIMKKSEVVRLKQVEHIRNEKEILMEVNHPFIVVMFTAFQNEANLFMLLEYIIGGELFTHLRKAGKFSNDHTRFYAAQIVMALQYLHYSNIVYRDLKPENLLIDLAGYMKITDFGFAKVVEDRTWTLCGTPEYLAPEIIQSKGHGKPVDWWALGILVYEMLAGYPPFYDENPFGIYQKILAGKLEFPRHFETHARDLIRKLLTADRTKRIGNLKNGAEDLKKHKWFRGLNWAALYNKQITAYIIPDVASNDDTSQYDKYADSVEGDTACLSADVDKELFNDF